MSTGVDRVGKEGSADVESVYSYDEPIAAKSVDFKHKQKFKGLTLLWLSYQATGVIYGDIGTSPLYVYSSTFTADPTYDDLLGVLSLIIWSLTIVVTIKYICIVLLADDDGEGGTFATYNLLSRYTRITKMDPSIETTTKLERYKTNDLRPSSRRIRSAIENNAFVRGLLKVLAVVGVSLIIADGVLTPAQSVLGAIQGIKVVDDSLTYKAIVGISVAILVVLYGLQPLGITKIAGAWAPIVIVWLTFNLAFGIYNLVHHDWTVLKAFSPYFAGHYFVRNGTDGWKSLGGILLAFTGVEALFADLGAFSRGAVRLSWLCLAYPCLLLAYIGQAAYISDIPSAYANPFFLTVPPGLFWPSLVLSILAAIVASQATITATFQLLAQIMDASYFPRISLTYTSVKFHGQVYIPMANWLLMIGTVIVTAVYNNTTSLGNAYGTCVILVTIITTMNVALVALIVWRIHWAIVLAIWLPIITFDGLFLSSVLTKVPTGAWSTLMIAAVLTLIFILWRYGKEQQWTAERKVRHDMGTLILKDDNGGWQLKPEFGGGKLTHIKGLLIFFDKVGARAPTVYEEFIRKFEARADVEVMLHFRKINYPYCNEEDKWTVARTSLPNCYRIVLRHGYKEVSMPENLGEAVYLELRRYLTRPPPENAVLAPSTDSEITSAPHGTITPVNNATRATKSLEALEHAYQSQTVYVVGKEQLRVLKSNNNIFKRIILGIFLWARDNTRNKAAGMRIPVEKLVEVGFVKEI